MTSDSKSQSTAEQAWISYLEKERWEDRIESWWWAGEVLHEVFVAGWGLGYKQGVDDAYDK